MSFTIRTAFSPRVRVCSSVSSPSLTKQSFKSECDINVIMARWAHNGTITHLRDSGGTYGDFSSVSDYQSAMNSVCAANAAFAALPSSLRTRFLNDPARFVDFALDPTNASEMISLGLATKKSEPLKGASSDPVARVEESTAPFSS